MSKKGIIFDLDGTLWDSSEQVVPAWNVVLKRYPQLNKEITTEDMNGFMGKTIKEIAGIIFPDMEKDKRAKILQECCNEELIFLSEHGGTLYPDLEKTIKELSTKYSLYIVSNCQEGYVQVFLDYHKLGGYFEDIEMSGKTGKNKGENIKLIMDRNKLEKAIYIGDTMGDLLGANYADIPFVHAKYGFGKVDNPQYSISNITEITELIQRIL